MPCNEADAVRLARLNGKKMAITIRNNNRKKVPIYHLKKILRIAYLRRIIMTSPFFYE